MDTNGSNQTLVAVDLAIDLVRCCLAAPPSPGGFAIHYGVSANTWRIWDIDEARTSVRYTPEDDAEQFRASSDMA